MAGILRCHSAWRSKIGLGIACDGPRRRDGIPDAPFARGADGGLFNEGEKEVMT
jgi:hypothetical protein